MLKSSLLSAASVTSSIHTDSFQSQKHSVCTLKAGWKCQEVIAPKSDLWSTRNRKELVDKSPTSSLIGGRIPKCVPSSLSSSLRVESHLPPVITVSLIYLLLIFLPCLPSPDPYQDIAGTLDKSLSKVQLLAKFKLGCWFRNPGWGLEICILTITPL